MTDQVGQVESEHQVAGISQVEPTQEQLNIDTHVWAERPVTVGAIVHYEGKLWRVGLVNASRARLDPLTGTTRVVRGREFTSYGDCVNIGASSELPTLDQVSTDAIQNDPTMAARLQRLISGPTKRASKQTEQTTTEQEGSDVAAVSAAPVPTKGNRAGKVKTAAKAQPKAKAEWAARAPKAEKGSNPCKCGCGEKTGGFFVAGHDARFKGQLLKIERGQMNVDDLRKSVRDSYKWVKRGAGMVPTTNYKGEPHKGYDTSKS